MSDQMDSGIKLFGRVIPLLPEAAQPGSPEAKAPAGSDEHPPAPSPVELEPDAHKVSLTRGLCLIDNSIRTFLYFPCKV
jgi:hypothetical protein